MLLSVPVQRPNGTLLWLPEGIASRLGLSRGDKLQSKHLSDAELAALIHSRKQANASGIKCDGPWHEKNGYS